MIAGQRLSDGRRLMAHGELVETMTRGDWNQDGPELVALRAQCSEALELLHASPPRPDALHGLLGHMGAGVEIVPTFRCSYGFNVSLGDNVFINADAFLMDDAPIRIADNVRLGPSVKLMTALHPVDDHARRRDGWERARGIDIGENAWLAAGVIVGAGVSIGRNTVVGAGSLVLSDLPDHVVAAGSPALVLRQTPVESLDRG